MANEPEPLDFDDAERGETQPTSAASSARHAETAERLQRNSAPAGDSAAVRGAGHRDADADAAHDESGDTSTT